MIAARIALCLALAAPAAALSASPERSTDGVYRLAWASDGAVVLEEARRADFSDARPVYRGAARATVLTGRADGTYHYRLRQAGGDGGTFGAPASVVVEHHALSRALAFFVTGGVVFVCTVALVLGGREGAHDA